MGRLTAHQPKTRTLGAAAGILAAIGGIASAHLVAGLTNPAASPVLAVSAVVIDATPTPVKELAVAQFGTADKPILLATVTLVTLAAAAVAGALSRRRLWLGIGFIVLLTGLATTAALTRPVAVPSDAVPGIVSTIVGLAILLGLLGLLGQRGAVTNSDAARLNGRATEDITGSGLPATGYPTSHDGRRQFLMQAKDAQRFEQKVGGATATVVRSPSLRKAVIVTTDMPAAPEGKVYELWLQQGTVMVRAGLMPAGQANTILLEGDAASAQAVGITVEPAGGSETPTLPPVAVISFA